MNENNNYNGGGYNGENYGTDNYNGGGYNQGNYNVDNYRYGNYQGNYSCNMNNNQNEKPQKNGFFKGFIIGGIIAAITVALIFGLYSVIKNDYLNVNPDGAASKDDIEKKAEQILKLIDENYYNVDDDYKDKLADSIYQGIIDSLDDKYADYYDAEEWKAVLEADQGVYCGIGVVVQKDESTGEIIAVNPYDYAPAYKAGVRANDRIIAIDDVDIRSMSIDEAVTLIRGEEGSTVKLTIRRDSEIKEFEVTREQIESKTIYTEVLEDNIGYMQITAFEGVTYDQFTEGLNDLLDKNIKGIIFDVRSNGGGYYDTVVKMLDRILPEGKIVYIEDKNGHQETEYSDAKCLDLPMCVLVNGYSASASEIFTGAIQDYGLGTIIGEKTYGKGIVQNTYTFRDGTAVKFTIAGYFTPNGRNIHGEGIEPDIEVSLPEDKSAYNEDGTIKKEMDSQLNEGIKYIKEQIK